MTWLERDPLLILETALARQKDCLLAANFDNLIDIDTMLQSALSKLNPSRLDPTGLLRLKNIVSLAKHQGILLQAALRGAQDARATRHGKRQFSSYDASGQTGQIGGARPRFEKRS